jgi:uncharacterized protein (DUF4415 family)
MIANRNSSPSDFDDDIPDMSTPEWRAKFAIAKVKRGRPPAIAPKISTTIRLDPDVLGAFQASGPGWQTRINAALKAWIAARETRAAKTRSKPAKSRTTPARRAKRAA